MNTLRRCLVCAGMLAACAASAAPPVTIVANPGPFASIEEAAGAELEIDWWDADTADDAASTECFAAVELKAYLPGCTNIAVDDIAFAKPDAVPTEGYVIVIGTRETNPAIAQLDPENKHAAPEDAEALKVTAWQDGPRTVCLLEGSDRVGALYSVYSYLEHLGIRFFGLGEQGTVYPDAPQALPESLDYSGKPAFFTRGFWTWEDRGDEDFFLWMAHNKLNFWTAYEKEVHFLKKLGMKLTVGGHDPQYLFLGPEEEYPYNHPLFDQDDAKPEDPYPAPPDDTYNGDADGDGKLTYFEAHPEWFGLYQGERQGKIGPEFGKVNICTTNPHATAELAKNFIAALAGQPTIAPDPEARKGIAEYAYTDIVNFWMLDNGKWCECEQCKAAGTPTDRLMLFINDIGQALNRAVEEGALHRHVEIATLAYHETLEPPTKPVPENFDYRHCYVTYFPIARTYSHSLGDPASTEINESHRKAIEGWLLGSDRPYEGDICIGEYYNVSSLKTLPTVYMTMMAIDIPWYYDLGARHFHYMHAPTRLWGPWTVNQYLMARLLWGPHYDSDEILDEYFGRFYPTATEEARRFYTHLEKAMSNIKAYKHYTPGYSLRNALNSRAENLFPLDTLQYNEHHPRLNDGIDVVQMLDELHAARQAVDEALLAVTNETERARLLEDEARFAYGEATILFYYHMARTTMFHNRGDEVLARHEFEKVERYAQRLRGIVELVNVSSSHANAADGLEATQITGAYEFMKKAYGPGAAAESK